MLNRSVCRVNLAFFLKNAYSFTIKYDVYYRCVIDAFYQLKFLYTPIAKSFFLDVVIWFSCNDNVAFVLYLWIYWIIVLHFFIGKTYFLSWDKMYETWFFFFFLNVQLALTCCFLCVYVHKGYFAIVFCCSSCMVFCFYYHDIVGPQSEFGIFPSF